jgi:hypothetical protein
MKTVMKRMIIVLACLFSLAGFAQNNKASQSRLRPLLDLYYGIKDALVNSDGAAAAAKASEYVKAIKAIDVAVLTEPEKKTFTALKDKLLFDAEHISETKDVTHQRDHFSDFSDNMYKLAKQANISVEPVYQAYCPMKKTYWLSKEKEIRNPYYGKQMITCGKVTDTLK